MVANFGFPMTKGSMVEAFHMQFYPVNKCDYDEVLVYVFCPAEKILKI